jgi:hypothetical protein
MSGEIELALARRQSRASLMGTWLDGGTLKLYDGTRPTDPDTAVTDQVLLASFTLPDPSGAASSGIWVGDLPEPTLILADGYPTWGRFADDQGNTVSDGGVGVSGSGNAIEVTNASFVAGAYASVTSMQIGEP